MRASVDRVVLVQETDFQLGGLTVCPSRRLVLAGNEREQLQPRIMQVLVALAQRRGEVVSRDELVASCWGGFAVGDDAVQRCVARLRRLGETHGGFSLETIPRVGYQLIEEAPAPANDVLPAEADAEPAGESDVGEANTAVPQASVPSVPNGRQNQIVLALVSFITGAAVTAAGFILARGF